MLDIQNAIQITAISQNWNECVSDDTTILQNFYARELPVMFNIGRDIEIDGWRTGIIVLQIEYEMSFHETTVTGALYTLSLKINTWKIGNTKVHM